MDSAKIQVKNLANKISVFVGASSLKPELQDTVFAWLVSL